jgi:hypothetical protein
MYRYCTYVQSNQSRKVSTYLCVHFIIYVGQPAYVRYHACTFNVQTALNSADWVNHSVSHALRSVMIE